MKIFKECKYCKEYFIPSRKTRQYCGVNCFNEIRRITKQCLYCYKTFVSIISKNKKYCSKSCKNKSYSHNHMQEKSPNWKGGQSCCVNCGILCGYNTKRCRKCYNKYNIGEDASNWKGGLIRVHCQICGEFYKVKKYRILYTKYCSKACMYKRNIGKIPWNKGLAGFMARDKNPAWKGGITPKNKLIRRSQEYKEWRQIVLKRDKYRCMICNSKKLLNIHHIKRFADYPELRCDINNGITLCKKCHKSIRNKEKEFEDLFQNIVNNKEILV